MPDNLLRPTATPTNLLRTQTIAEQPTRPVTTPVQGEGGFVKQSVGDMVSYAIPEPFKVTKYSLEDYISGEPFKKEIGKEVGLAHQTAQGLLGAMSFGIVPRLVQELPKESQEFLAPKNTAEEIAYRIGNLWGFSNAIKGLLTKGPLAAISRLQPTTVKGVIGKHLLKGGVTLGGYSFLSEWGGKDIVDNLKKRGASAVGGAALGMAFSAVNMITGDVLGELAKKTKISPKDSWTALTAFALRLGANELLVGAPAYERFKKGEESLPGLIYEIGLGVMFSTSGNPLRLELDFNRAVKRNYELKQMTQESLAQKMLEYGDMRAIPQDMKWAYIMKASGGTIKPSQKNAGSGDFIFEELLKNRDPKVHDTIKTLTDIKVGIETQMEGVKQAMEAKGMPEIKSRDIKIVVNYTQDKDITNTYIHDYKVTGIPEKDYNRLIKQITNKVANKDAIQDIHIVGSRSAGEFRRQQEGIEPWNQASDLDILIVPKKGEYIDLRELEYDYDGVELYNPGQFKTSDGQVLEFDIIIGKPGKVAKEYRKYDGHDTNLQILETKTIKVPSNISIEVPDSLRQQEQDLNIEMATGSDVGVLKRTGRAMGMNDNMINRFLKAYTDGDYTLSKLKGKIPKEQLEQLRQMMKQLVTGYGGKAKIPVSKEILPMDFFEWRKGRGNVFDWLQSARIPIKPIYDLVKPAYTAYMESRRVNMARLNKIYGKRIKRGSDIDQKLAMYADGKINLDDIPKEYQDIAIAREQFYQEYADRLMKLGLLPPEKVFDKEGNRKPYYHRIFDGALQQAFDAGFALDDLYLPGKMPTPGALKKRMGAWGYKFSAIESDLKYVYGIEKYINMHREMKAATDYANQITGMRRSMANAYLRAMRGQPTNIDRTIKESMQSVVRGTGEMLSQMGMKNIGDKLLNWQAPTYPLSRATSPLARFYYWRYIGLAVDTAFKNAFQMTHTLARYGPENVAKAQRMIFTPEGKKIIDASGVMSEGIQRGGSFIEEAGSKDRLGKIEEASYWLFEKTENNNRRVSALAGYLEAESKGMSYGQCLKEAWKAAHETQYGYTKADSLLVDLANPAARFILFKKWPMGKVEMMRSWIRDGHTDALFNLALTEYVVYRAAQRVGVDLGPQFNAIWQMATRGVEDWKDLFPIVSEVADIATMFGGGKDADAARERVIKAWEGAGNRYIGKIVEFGRHWLNDWEVRDHQGKLQYQSSAREQATNLFVRPLEATQRAEKNKRMAQVGQEVDNLREQIILSIINGQEDKAAKLQMYMENKYGEEYAQEFGKALQPITPKDVIEYRQRQEVPTAERVRRGMPGKGAPVKGRQEFKGEKAPTNLMNVIRGY